MHLPAKLRRQVVYASATMLLVGGLLYSVKPNKADKPANPPSALASKPFTPDTFDAKVVANETQAPALGVAMPPAPRRAPGAQPKVTSYAVVPGDTVGTIAERFGLQTESLLWANDLNGSDLLQIGQELKIPAVDGMVHTVRSGDTLWGLASDYDVDFTVIVEANPDVDPEALQPGQVLLVPGGQPVFRRLSTMVASRGSERATASGSFSRWPLSGAITDWFGWRTHPVYGTSHYHDGIDIDAHEGTPVAAVKDGRVVYAGRLGGYGITVKVDHGDGTVTMYAHLSQANVNVGQGVSGGQQIALSGNTGTSTGPHLHFTVFVGGAPVDPMSWLP